jgi:hypothetical protein
VYLLHIIKEFAAGNERIADYSADHMLVLERRRRRLFGFPSWPVRHE